jgi:hypothetical protein
MVERFEFDAGIKLELGLLEQDSRADAISGLRVIR